VRPGAHGWETRRADTSGHDSGLGKASTTGSPISAVSQWGGGLHRTNPNRP